MTDEQRSGWVWLRVPNDPELRVRSYVAEELARCAENMGAVLVGEIEEMPLSVLDEAADTVTFRQRMKEKP